MFDNIISLMKEHKDALATSLDANKERIELQIKAMKQERQLLKDQAAILQDDSKILASSVNASIVDEKLEPYDMIKLAMQKSKMPVKISWNDLTFSALVDDKS